MKLAAKIIAALIVLSVFVVFFGGSAHTAPFYYQRASAKFAKGDVIAAFSDYNKAIKLKPDYVDAYIGRGDAAYAKGDPRGAMADYNKAIELKPELKQIPNLPQTPEATITNEIAAQVLVLFNAKDYDKLDNLAAKLRSSKERYSDGVWKLTCVFDGLNPSVQSSNQEWEARLSYIELWAVARPDSITPQIARANTLVAYAWKARGSQEASTVSPEGWRLFETRLIEAVKVLKQSKSLKEQCPLFWRVLMRAALGLSADKAQFNAVFDAAIKFEPDFEGHYTRRAIYLLPQWHGSKGEWLTDLTQSADKIGGANGDMLYAQVIWNLNQAYNVENLLLEDNVSWTRADKGFEIIGKQFPDSLVVKIERTHLAILVKEAPAIAYYNTGLDSQLKGDWGNAITNYNEAIKLKPDYSDAYVGRGRSKNALMDFQGSLADLNQAIKIKSDDGLAFYNRGKTKFSMGDIVGALADYNKAIEFDPAYARSYVGRGKAKRAHHDNDGAMADFCKAIELKPDLAVAYSERGFLKVNSGDKAGATADFDQAAKLTQSGK